MIDNPILEMRGITKSFPGVRALRRVDLELAEGEVLALLGENGAGKSTLIKILGGAQPLDAGSIAIDGRQLILDSPMAARRAGVSVIYQEFNLVPGLSARENIFLGQECSTAGYVHRRYEQRRARELFERLHIVVPTETPSRHLTVAQQQAVEIAKALAQRSRIIVMDEPTATLTMQETAALFAVIRDLKADGIGVIYISHRLEEIFTLADRVMVLRDGEHVGTRSVETLDRRQLIEMMVGRSLESEFPRRNVTIGQPRLLVHHLRGEKLRGEISFAIRDGEVLVLTGLVGAGRTETARLIFGADRVISGSIELDGRRLSIRSPRDAIRAGICLLTEDRKNQGLILGQSVLENFGLPNLPMFSTLGVIHTRDERDTFARYVEQLRIKIPHPREKAGNLSGGNQQKIVLAKWLQSNSEVIIFDEPTRGIDVGAKYEIYTLINELAARGKAILIISSEMPEVLGMADRILVMHEGRITGEITDVAAATQEQIMELAVQ